MIEAASATVPVILAPQPFTPRVERLETPEGSTVQEILLAAVRSGLLPLADVSRAEVYLDGERLERTREALAVRPRAGQFVNIAVQVQGGGGHKSPFAIVLQIALIVLTVAVTGPGGLMASLGASTILRTAAAAGMTLLGGAGISALFAPKGAGGAANQAYSLQGQSNQARPRQTFSLCLGERRVAFDIVSSAYSSTEGDNTYMHVIFAPNHYGPCEVHDIRLGETAIEAFDYGEVVTERFLTPGPRAFSLYPMRVVQESYSAELDHEHQDWATHTSAIDAERLEMDLFAPVLFFKDTDWADLYIEIQVSAAGSGSWAPMTGFTANGSPAPTTDRHGTALAAGTLYLKGKTHEPVRETLSWTPPTKGQYDVRMRRNVRPDASNSNDAISWSAMRTIENKKPVLDENLPCIAMKIKASTDVNGTLPPVTGRVIPWAPIWDGEAWTDDFGSWTSGCQWSPTSNAAALARWMLMFQPAAKPLQASEIDASFADQYALIEAQGWGCAVLLNEDGITQADALGQLGQAGRFNAYWNGQAMCLSPDWTKAAPRQLFSGRNVQGYRRTRAIPDAVHAVLVEFLNTDTDSQADMVTVYAAGYDESTATLFETLQLKLACTAARAGREGLVYLAKRQAQQTVHEWTAGAEAIVSTLGDRVLVERRTALTALQSYRVLYRRWSGGLVSGLRLDGLVAMETGKTYALDGPLNSGDAARGVALTTVVGASREVAFATPQAANAVPAAGGLVVVGETGKTTLDLEIVDVQPQDGMQAQISAVDYAGAAIVEAWSGTPTDTGGTTPAAAVASPTILNATGTPDGVYVHFAALQQRLSPIDHFAARWRLSPTSDNPSPPWKALPDLPATARALQTPPFPDAPGVAGYAVDVELRTVLQTGAMSLPSKAYSVAIALSLPIPENFDAQGVVRVAPDGSSYGAIAVSCDPVLTGRTQDLIVELQPAGSSPADWKAAATLKAANPVGDVISVMGGQAYDVRAQWRSADNWTSDWVIVTDVAVPEGADVAANAVRLAERLVADVLASVDRANATVDAAVKTLMETAASLWVWHSELQPRAYLDNVPIGEVINIIGGLNADHSAFVANADSFYLTPTESFASRFTQIAADIGTASAAVTTEAAARVSADTAEASLRTSLTATVNSNYSTVTASIVNEASVRASADSAAAVTVSSLTSTVNGNTASIVTVSATLATTNSTVASLSSTVSANYGTLSASVSTNATAIATATGQLYARYVIEANANGNLAKMTLLSGSGLSYPFGNAIVFETDNFLIRSGTNSALPPFFFSGGALYSDYIVARAANIQALAVQTLHIADGNVIAAFGAAGGARTLTNGDPGSDLDASVVHTCNGTGTVDLDVTLEVTPPSGGGAVTCRVYRDGSTMNTYNWGWSTNYAQTIGFGVTDNSPTAGSHTYKVRVWANNTGTNLASSRIGGRENKK